MSSYDPIAEDRRLARLGQLRPPMVTIRPGMGIAPVSTGGSGSPRLGRDVETTFEPLADRSREWDAAAAAMSAAAGRASLVAAVYARQRP